MIFRYVLVISLSCGALSHDDLEDRGAATTVLPNGASIAQAAEAATPAVKMCDVCSCEDRIVQCTARRLRHHFNASEWPSGPFDEVSFEHNELVHLKAFPNVTISKLILKDNSITKIDDETFKLLRNLIELDLSHNQLTSENLSPHNFRGKYSPDGYQPLSELTILRLSYNDLHTLHQDLFEHMQNLERLFLAGNPFYVLDHSTTLAISTIPYLNELDLSECSLSELPEYFFHTPKYLKKVNLNGNKLTEPPVALKEAKGLESVSLDNNPIELISSNVSFPEMPELKQLSLCCMQNLTSIGPGAFSGLPKLEVLHIEGCPLLTTIDEDAFVREVDGIQKWPNLTKLELSDNALQYLPGKLIQSWENLEVLELRNNMWSCDCRNQFLIGSLLPGRALKNDTVDGLTCAGPSAYEKKNLTSLAGQTLRCLDRNSGRSQRDAAILVGVLISVLVAVPLTLAFFVFWRRGFFFCGKQGPATFSRAFYTRADNEDEFM